VAVFLAMSVNSESLFGRRQSETALPLSAHSRPAGKSRRPKLVGMLVVVGVIVILVTILIPPMPSDSPRKTAARADIQGSIKTALDRYEVEEGSYPKNLQDLLTQSDDAKHWSGSFLDALPLDPWAHPYVYIFPGHHNSKGYDLFSTGPDGQPGTADDIGNWGAK
jgi:general secretion pathway protein G